MRHRPMILATGFPLHRISTHMLEATSRILAAAHLKSHADLLEVPILLNFGDPLGSAFGSARIVFALRLALTFAFRSLRSRRGCLW